MAYRLAIPATASLLYCAFAALWLWGPHTIYFNILRLFGFEPFRFPFLDIHAVLSAAQCHRLGVDVYLTNPCDALGRVHAYSPLWLRITPAFLDTSNITVVGLSLGLLFIASLMALCRPTTRGEALLMMFTAVSPMTVYVLERANSDLVGFLLILAGCTLLRAPRPTRFVGYGLVFFAGLLRYFPLLLLVMLARERRRSAISVAIVMSSVLLVLVLCDYAELRKALANIPQLSYFADSFAAVNLPFGLASALAIPFQRALAVMLLALLIVLTAARTRRSLAIVGHAALDWHAFKADCMVVGALLVIACFFAGQNVDYRGVYFVLVMPGLLHLRRIACTAEARRFLSSIVAGVLLVAWEQVFRRIDHAATAYIPSEAIRVRAELLFWLGRELVWWWLIAGLTAIVLSYLRQLPLVNDAAARFPTLSLLPRQPSR